MSEPHVWLSSDATGPVLAELRQVSAEVTAMVHRNTGDDRRDIRDALLEVAFLLGAAEERLTGQFTDPEPLPDLPDVGHVTGDVVRRMRTNSGKHRSGQ